MSHEMQSLAVAGIVLIAAYSLAHRILARGSAGSSSSACGQGCGSCSASKQPPLVQLSKAPHAGNAGENGS